jgi:hypothetical protein
MAAKKILSLGQVQGQDFARRLSLRSRPQNGSTFAIAGLYRGKQ